MDSICKHPGSRTRDCVQSFRVDSSGRVGCGSAAENRAPIIRLLQTSSTIHHLSRKFSMVTATQSMNRSDIHRVLSEWPVGIERKGTLINNFGESIPFAEFILGGNLLMVDRGIPDTAGPGA